MIIMLKNIKRPKAEILFPVTRLRTKPRRCYMSGMTMKHQLPWPPPWRKGKGFNNPKYYPLDIDHLSEDYRDNRTANLSFACKVYHVEKTEKSWKFVMRRKVRKG